MHWESSPTGFTTLGTPDDWDVASDGDFRIILNNRLANQITVYTISASLGGSVPVTYDTMNCTGNDAYMTIGPGATSDPTAICTNPLNPYSIDLGSPTADTTYSVDVSILYNSVGFNHTETGKLTGTVSS